MVLVEKLSLNMSRGLTVSSDGFAFGPIWRRVRHSTVSGCAFKLARFLPNEICETDYGAGEGNRVDMECILRFNSRYTT
jgi:hypothetical protein